MINYLILTYTLGNRIRNTWLHLDFKAIQNNLKINAMQLMQRIKRLCKSDMNQIEIN